jgi:hypothetical protein
VTLGGAALGAMNATHLDLPEPAGAWAGRLAWAKPAVGPRSRSQAPAFFKATLTATGSEVAIGGTVVFMPP